MATVTQIKLSDILVVRDVEPEPLPDGLPKKVYDAPVILRGDRVLVDGLRRIRRARAKGAETINAIVSSDFLTIIEALKSQHEDIGIHPTPRRTWEMYEQVFPMGDVWSKQRFNGGWEVLPGGKRVRRSPSTERVPSQDRAIRGQFMAAFGHSDSMLSHIVNLYRKAEAGYDHARELVGAVEQGIISPSQAVRNFHRPYNMTGNVRGLKEQRQLLERGTAGLAAHAAALSKMGAPIEVPPEELAEFLKSMRDSRRIVSEMINGFKKVLKEAEVTHG